MISKSHTFFSAIKKRPVKALAFASPLLISIPECPPKMPWNLKSRQRPDFGSLFIGISVCTRIPPAQPTVKIPSSSESTFRSLFALQQDKSMPVAPIKPTSSETVKTTSRRGRGMDGSSKSASP